MPLPSSLFPLPFGLFAIALCLAVAQTLPAQVVRGVVRESESGAPLAGVLVALDDAGEGAPAGESLRRATLIRAVLSDERGEFAIAAGRPGRFVLSAKRIGARRFVSGPFALDAGETTRLEVTLEPLRFDLPPVAVTASSPCSREPDEALRIAALWEEARAALTATQISLRDRLFRATITRYSRSLQTRSFRVLREDREEQRGVTEQPFISIPVESLSARGYRHEESDGSAIYFAPDATVLLSDAFVREHCFSVSVGRGTRANLIGLAFTPVRERALADIRGTIWLDAQTFELRLVEFRYVNVDPPTNDPWPGGEVHFARLPSGAWIVSRWFIRMPEYGSGSAPVAGTVPYSSTRLTVVRFQESAGDVGVEAGTVPRRFASLAGRVVDSTGRPFPNGVVRVSGTRYATPVLPDGSFRLDSLPSGAYTLLVEHPDYALLGVFAAEQDLTIEEERSSQTYIRALGSEQLVRRLCSVGELPPDHAALRVVVRDEATAELVAGAEVRLEWTTFESVGRNQLAKAPRTMTTRTDDRGGATFCPIPARTIIRVETPRGAGGEPAYRSHKLAPLSIGVVELRR